MKTEVYIVFIHNYDENHSLLYGGWFSTREKAAEVCKKWNNVNESENRFADFINVTNEKDEEFILRRG